MGRPDDIPQDVWEGATNTLDRMLCNAGYEGSRDYSIAEIARAIMAAKAGEAERIAQMADALADLFDGHAMRCSDEMDIVEARGAESAIRKFAAELRGEV